MSRHTCAAAILAALLAAGPSPAWSDDRGLSVKTSPPTAAAGVATIHTFQCGTLVVQVRFHPAGAAELMMEGRALTLPQAVSASGARYADAAGNQFWNKGKDAVLTLAGQEDVDCLGTSP